MGTMLHLSPYDKADQLERDFNVRHPIKALYAGLRTRDDYHEVTPFHVAVGTDRLSELGRDHAEEDALIVLLMRGARIEAVAKAAGETADLLADLVRQRLRQLNEFDLGELISESQRNLDLLRRA